MSNNCSPKCECKTGGMAEKVRLLGDPAYTPPEPYDVTGSIIAYESGELEGDGIVELFAHLIKTGLAWQLQGHYGRTAAALIEGGCIDRNGTILKYPGDED